MAHLNLFPLHAFRRETEGGRTSRSPEPLTIHYPDYLESAWTFS